MHRIIAAVLAVFCAAVAQGQTVPPAQAGPVLTLEQALDHARAASPALDAAAAGLRAADARRAVAALRPNPSLVAETANVAGSGQYQGFRSAETTIGLAVPIETGGKRSARVALADAQGARTALEVLAADADLVLRVTQAYAHAAAATKRAGALRDQAGIARDMLNAAHVRVRAGRASPLEEQRADVGRINAEAALDRALRGQALADETLARLIGMEAPGVPDPGWFDRIDEAGPPAPIGIDDTLAAAGARADLAAADAQIRLARSQRVPDITVSASARRLEATGDVAAVFGLSVPLALFNGGRAQLGVATAQRDQAEALRRLARLDAAQAIATARTEVADAAAAARAATGPALAAATEAARIARIGYREGKFGQLDLLDAERALAETRATAIDALAAYHDARARLARLTAVAQPIAKDTAR
ncbi:MAG: TolC family protein [Pseudomonadota bacterium]